jgi:hypothetical protein
MKLSGKRTLFIKYLQLNAGETIKTVAHPGLNPHDKFLIWAPQILAKAFQFQSNLNKLLCSFFFGAADIGGFFKKINFLCR